MISFEKQAHELLQEHFGYQNFRNGQYEIIDSITKGNDTFVVMPTGGGKSLCYQIPALLSEGTALVISPLIALMKDQVDALQNARISATYVNSSLHYSEIQQRMINAKFGMYKLLYVSPERLESTQFIEQLKEIKLSFLAIDEAHCISEWGHDFRPSYTNIPTLFQHIPRIPQIALTATATPEVQQDIITVLNLTSPNRFTRGFDRPNLRYITETSSTKVERAVDYLNQTKFGSSILYCGSRKRVEETANALMRYGIQAQAYHAGMNESQRSSIQDKFISGDARVLVATSAFGMGVDKRDVRNVIHLDMTSTLESYYQEAGRAGRDGEPSKCVMLHQQSDRKLQEFFIYSSHPEMDSIAKVYTAMYDLLSVGRGEKSQHPLYMDDVQLANHCGLASATVSGVMSLFERSELLRRGNTQGLATINFTAERTRLIEYFNQTVPERKVVLEALLRSIGSEAIGQSVQIDIQSLLNKYSLSLQQFQTAIRAFEYARLLRFEAVATQNGITLLLERMPVARLPIDFKGLEERRERAFKKLDVVQRYIQTTECKRNYILTYFQEDDIETICGKCSSCTSSEVKKVTLKSQDEYVLRAILEVVGELDGRFGRMAVAQVLVGESSTKVKMFGLDKSERFGTLKKFSSKEVVAYIDSAISDRLLHLSSSTYPTVKLSPTGKEKLGKSLPKTLVLDSSPNSSRQIGELQQSLKRTRDEIASRYSVSRSTIATDEQLYEMAIIQPQKSADFVKIRGLGEQFVSRWAKDFLRVLDYERAKEQNSTKDQKNTLSYTVQLTVDLANQGLGVESIAQERGITTGTVAMHIQEAIERGATVRRANIVSDEVYTACYDIIRQRPKALLKDIRVVIGGETDYAVLRIATAFARKELIANEPTWMA
jgi:ATP-dependent DNA helicase RecQ